MALKIVNFSSFNLFLKVLDFSRKLPSQISIVGLNRTSFGELPCFSGYAQVFQTKSYGPQKNQFYEFFDRFLKLFVFSQKNPPKIWGFRLNEYIGLWKTPQLEWLCPIFKQKLWSSEKSTFQFCNIFFKFFDFSRKLPSQIWNFGFNS